MRENISYSPQLETILLQPSAVTRPASSYSLQLETAPLDKSQHHHQTTTPATNTGDMSFLETGDMSFLETGDMSFLETGDMSLLEPAVMGYPAEGIAGQVRKPGGANKRPARGYHTFKNGCINVSPKGAEKEL